MDPKISSIHPRSSQKRFTETGAIVGGTVGGVAALTITGVLVVSYRRHRHQRPRQRQHQHTTPPEPSVPPNESLTRWSHH